MNILFLTPRNSKKYLGGVEGHVRILTEELVKRGHQIKELALDEIDGLNKGPALLQQGRALGYKFRAWGYLWRNRDLFKWADVVHIHDVFWWWLPFGLLNLLGVWGDEGNRGLFKGSWRNLEDFRGMKRGRPAFITFHGWEGVCPPSWSAVIQKRLASWLSNGTIGVGSFYEKWYGVKPDRIVWGVSTNINKGQAFRLAKGRALRKIVFLGRMEKVNGIEILLGAIKVTPWLRPRCNLFRFIFVGEGSYRKQAEKFGKVTGMIKDPQKYLVDADIVITSSYMSMLEAAAMGKPVIAIANNELKDDYLKTHPMRKWMVVCKNSEELVGRIASLQLRKDAIRAAQDWAVGQTPERLADVYEGLWNLK